LFNSIEPSFSTHSLQIYCIKLIGPISHTFWAWTVNQDPTTIIIIIIITTTTTTTEYHTKHIINKLIAKLMVVNWNEKNKIKINVTMHI